MSRSDVVIVGAGIVGACTAYWLRTLAPQLSVTLIERDTTFARASSALSASSLRQQFSSRINVRLSQAGLEFLKTAPQRLAIDGEPAPAIGWHEGGYLYLAGSDDEAQTLRRRHRLLRELGADVALLPRDALARRFGWLHSDDLTLASLGESGEGWFDGPALHAAVLRKARRLGATLRTDEAAGFEFDAGRRRISAVRLASGAALHCGHVVDAAGPWARALAQAAGIALPVAARRRTVFVLSCAEPPSGCPLVIDPAGFWFRPEGRHFLCGFTPDHDADDLPLEPDLKELDERRWALLAHRVPAFGALRIERAWAGYYEMNLFDHNAIIGPHPELPNLLLANGFSGHGMQQAAPAARGLAEWLVHGDYRTLDLRELGIERILAGRPLREDCVIG